MPDLKKNDNFTLPIRFHKKACLNQLRPIARMPKSHDITDFESELLVNQDALTKIILADPP